MSSTKYSISAEECDLFRQTMYGVKLLNGDLYTPPPPCETNPIEDIPKPEIKPQTISYKARPAQSSPMQTATSTTTEFEQTLSAYDAIQFCPPQVNQKQYRRLKQGKEPYQDKFDLHGMNLETAKHYLLDFLHTSVLQGYRTVLVVHGKGYRSENNTPVLKNKIISWLREDAHVLAFCSAQPRDGGTGAVYILLRGKS